MAMGYEMAMIIVRSYPIPIRLMLMKTAQVMPVNPIPMKMASLTMRTNAPTWRNTILLAIPAIGTKTAIA